MAQVARANFLLSGCGCHHDALALTCVEGRACRWRQCVTACQAAGKGRKKRHLSVPFFAVLKQTFQFIGICH
jgi:hypothetical protein